MALHIEWGTSEAEQLTDDHMARFFRAGIVAAYTYYFRDMQENVSGSLCREFTYSIDLFLVFIPLLGMTFTREAGVVYVPDNHSHTLALAKVDPGNGVRLDKTLLSVAYVAPGHSPGPWSVKEMIPDTGFDEPQARLILAHAIELRSHGLESR
jgi:hypothetical protein